ncbi:transporter substrate-binding domain-containing protein [Leucobacter sp. CSA1]|uniref:Transporter substrate-binding domain-containing protein n=1 Tax=Leucobacter chromiisoli TaxID=2796471 RepID=A0A934Q5J7_9MICO|nr:transporter substrate-binding domain-containing protein [Leucobacter chromiisoli]MBK0418800.1 transporter substrate-binding domain-containing protein [Leucobacter chromiisoli]
MKLMRTAGAAIAAVALATSLAACSGSSDADLSTFEKAQKTGEVDVALASLEPDSNLTPSGEVTGYVPEVTLAALEEYGITKLNGSVAEFEAFIPGLQASRWSMVTTGLTVTSERCEAVLFSNPLTVLQEALVYPTGNPDDISSYDDFSTESGLNLAVLTGSSQEKYALEQGVPAERLVKVSDSSGLIDSVVSGRADAFALGNIGIVGLLKPYADQLEYNLVEGAPVSATAVAFREEDRDFRDKFNEQLEKLRSDGSLEQMFEEWFGEENPGLTEATSLDPFAEGCE